MDWEGKLGRGVWLLSLMVVLGWLAIWPPTGSWGRELFWGLAVVVGLSGMASMADWLLWRGGLRLEQLERARSAAQTQLAEALRGLSERQTGMVEKVGTLSLEALLGESGAQWAIRGPGLRNIPLEVMQDFLELSGETRPFLWPVREHEEFASRFGYENSEAWLSACTRVLVDVGWAEAATGPYAARVVKDWDWVRVQFGITEALRY